MLLGNCVASFKPGLIQVPMWKSCGRKILRWLTCRTLLVHTWFPLRAVGSLNLHGWSGNGLVSWRSSRDRTRAVLLLPAQSIQREIGRTCKHCGKYYVKKAGRQIVYCSQRCGRKHTSKISMQQQRQQEHLETIGRAKQYLAKWASTNTRKGWKEWVSDQALISGHWLSRHVGKGELVVPVKSIRSKHAKAR